MLNRVWSKVDALVTQYRLLKVDVAGDSYMCGSGILSESADHAGAVGRFALDVLRELATEPVAEDMPELGRVRLRVGLNSGPVVSSMIGATTPRWSLFGDTVNVASRMETTSLPGRVHISAATAGEIMRHSKSLAKQIQRRPGVLTVKGKGQLVTYWLNERQPVKRSPSWEDELLRPKVTVSRTRSHSFELPRADVAL